MDIKKLLNICKKEYGGLKQNATTSEETKLIQRNKSGIEYNESLNKPRKRKRLKHITPGF